MRFSPLYDLAELLRVFLNLDGDDNIAGVGVGLGVANASVENAQHATVVGDFAKDGVQVVEVWGGDVSDEELRAVGVGAGVCHGEDAGAIVSEVGVEFVVEAIAGSAAAGAGRVTGLGHEVGDDAVEGGAVVVAQAGEVDEVVDGDGDEVGEEVEVDVTFFGDYGGGVSVFVVDEGVFGRGVVF